MSTKFERAFDTESGRGKTRTVFTQRDYFGSFEDLPKLLLRLLATRSVRLPRSTFPTNTNININNWNHNLTWRLLPLVQRPNFTPVAREPLPPPPPKKCRHFGEWPCIWGRETRRQTTHSLLNRCCCRGLQNVFFFLGGGNREEERGGAKLFLANKEGAAQSEIGKGRAERKNGRGRKKGGERPIFHFGFCGRTRRGRKEKRR